MENLVTTTMKMRTQSGEHHHHVHPYASPVVGGVTTGPSTNIVLHHAQQIGSAPSNDFSDLEFYSGPGSHDVVTWKNVGHAAENVGRLVHGNHAGAFGLPVGSPGQVDQNTGMEALALRITTGNGSLGSRSDGTDLVIDDLIR